MDIYTVLALTMVLAAIAFIIVFVQTLYIIQLKQTLKKPQSPTPSEELSDFLRDFHIHGYSFVRVNPDNIYMRK